MNSRRVEIEQVARRFGSANCWTGTSGMLSALIIEAMNMTKFNEDLLKADHSMQFAISSLQIAAAQAIATEDCEIASLIDDALKLLVRIRALQPVE